jgi:hypothetical protein
VNLKLSQMRFTKQGYKELLVNKANLIISDGLSVEDMVSLAENASETKRNLTIRSTETNLEDLKKIAAKGEGFVTIEIIG